MSNLQKQLEDATNKRRLKVFTSGFGVWGLIRVCRRALARVLGFMVELVCPWV